MLPNGNKTWVIAEKGVRKDQISVRVVLSKKCVQTRMIVLLHAVKPGHNVRTSDK